MLVSAVRRSVLALYRYIRGLGLAVLGLFVTYAMARVVSADGLSLARPHDNGRACGEGSFKVEQRTGALSHVRSCLNGGRSRGQNGPG